ncbi:sulfite exporter TauE/SafE family protein [Texcoconibacillus texcoconensis]|uniref:Cytochrome c biogenesis protein CcdA n=1 Tax=Texcoconibacillus texcoconensis TaxID=1095777 RepID=A0A840QPH4_9BACI|nr:sulfite exporter TauE/SafE family protein [Texcoconibacillus texcoconensis]MBB5173270.1 cytochrome c biogenesis protein CcdA [Texcoconibacillus texcoconensis]
MFELVDQISYFFREPFLNAANQFENIPILAAFLLGVVGALAPCQFSGNISAITLYGTKSVNKGISGWDTSFYVLGKIVAFSGIGFIVWLLGQEFQQSLTEFFPWIRRLIGPMLILIGLYMLGLIRMHWTLNLWKQNEMKKEGKWGAFLLGFSFSLAFCPTMFLLFFMTLMPLVLSTSYGAILPSIFAVGTSIPFLIVIGVIWYLGFSGGVMKKGRKLGMVVQKVAGGMMIFIGVMDILTFW